MGLSKACLEFRMKRYVRCRIEAAERGSGNFLYGFGVFNMCMKNLDSNVSGKCTPVYSAHSEMQIGDIVDV
jgi:hypothetical protein